MVERGGPVKAFVVPDVTRATLLPLIEKHIKKGTLVSSDEFKVYRNLRKVGYPHKTVNHSREQWANGITHTNTIEGFWSHLKRGISSTHVSVSKKHLQKYVGEFQYRYNNRQAPTEMFDRMLAQISMPTEA